MKKVLTFLLVGALAICSFASSGVNNFAATHAEADYEIWSAPYTEKILRETAFDYSAYKSTPKVDLDMARAETETAQIVITANKPVGAYNLTVEDLKTDAGEVLAKSNIEVFAAMYVYVSYLYDSVRSYSKGYFPDAMLPIEKAVEYGENTVAENSNQSIYVSVTSAWNQPAGVYKGTFTLETDGKKTSVPVSVKVRDCTVSTKVTSKSIFSDSWTHHLGELDATQRMTDNYHKALLKYRLCPNFIVDDKNYTDADMDYLCEKVLEMYEYGTDEEKFGKGSDRFTNFTLPLGFNNSSDGVKTAAVNMLTKIAEMSCREGVDFVDRAYIYTIDEPEANNNFNGQKAMHEMFLRVKNEIAAKIEGQRAYYKSTYNVTDEFVDKLVDSAKTLHNIVTQSYMDKYDGFVDTWCPTFDSYDSLQAVEKYKKQNDERWWYGCIVPLAPYPTYHVSDILLSPRVASWLQSYNDITGNLYWATEQWAGYHILPGEGRAYRFSDEYYTEAGPYDNVAGEGYLFRPGKKYGIDGPIPTIRIDAIRDGLEEYEMMEEIKTVYAAAGLAEGKKWSAYPVFNELLAPLASGVQVGATSEGFAASRTTLLELFELAEKGVCLVDYNDDGNGKITYGLYVPTNSTVKCDVGTQTGSQVLSGGTLKTFVVDLQNAKSGKVTFDIGVGDKNYALSMALSGGVTVIDAENLIGSLTGDLSENGLRVVDADLIVAGKQGKLVEMSVAAIDAKDSYGYQYVRLTDDVLKSVNQSLSKLAINFYYGGDDPLSFRLCVKYKNNRAIVEECKGTLNKGFNSIIWGNLNSKSWKNGDIEYVEFCFDDQSIGSALPARIVYFESISLYSAGV